MMTSRTGGPPLSFPETLAGTLPAIGEPLSRHDLHHVAALDEVGTAITSLHRGVRRSMRGDKRQSLTESLRSLAAWRQATRRLDHLSRRIRRLVSGTQTSHAGIG